MCGDDADAPPAVRIGAHQVRELERRLPKEVAAPELPVDQHLELHQLVAHVDQVDQARPQEIILLGSAGFRLHRHIRNRRVHVRIG